MPRKKVVTNENETALPSTVTENEKESSREKSTPSTIMKAGHSNNAGFAKHKTSGQSFFDVDYNELDRDLSPDQLREWTSIYASYRSKTPLSGTIIGVDMHRLAITDPNTKNVERKQILCLVLMDFRVKVIIPQTEIWYDAKESFPDYVIRRMIGAKIDYVITNVDRPGDCAIASRRMALGYARNHFFRDRQRNETGKILKCNVVVVGPSRIIAECKRTDESTLITNARIFNKEIMEHVLSCEEYPAFKAICEGRDLPAYEAVKEFSEQIFAKLDELLNAANGAKDKDDKNLLDLLHKIEAQQEKLIEQISNQLDHHKNGKLNEDAEKSLLKAAYYVNSKQRQIDNLSDMLKQNIRKSKEVFQDAVFAAVASAKEKAEQTDGIISSWGLEGPNPETIKHNTELLQRVKNNDKIAGIAKYLGKYREILDNARKNSFAFGRGDKYDIALGNDYTRAVSSEYAYLSLPETVPLFIQKVQRKALKQYRKRERIAKGHGDIVICLDESGSTRGEAIAWGKALALTLMEAANRNGQNCVIIRFSGIGEVQPHFFLQHKFTTEDILSFADSFLGGGTEFKGPLTKAVDIIENEGFRDADLLFLTDGDCAVDSEFANNFKEKRTNLNFTVTGIVLDKGTRGSTLCLNEICDRVYKLSELTEDELSEELIKRAA